MDKKTSKQSFKITILGTLFSALGILIGYYLTVYYEKKPDLKFQIISNTEILDVKEDIAGLEILYKDINLRKSNKNISLLIIKVINEGKIDILNNLYDENLDFGLRITQAKPIGKPILTDILGANFNSPFDFEKMQLDENTIILKKLVFDKNTFFVFKILVIHDKNKKPMLSTIGKIAGQKNLKIEVNPLKEKSVLEKIFPFFILIIMILLSLFFLVVYRQRRYIAEINKRLDSK